MRKRVGVVILIVCVLALVFVVSRIFSRSVNPLEIMSFRDEGGMLSPEEKGEVQKRMIGRDEGNIPNAEEKESIIELMQTKTN